MLTIDKELDNILARLAWTGKYTDSGQEVVSAGEVSKAHQAIKALMMKQNLKAVREDRLNNVYFYKIQVNDLFNHEIRVYEQALSTSKESEE